MSHIISRDPRQRNSTSLITEMSWTSYHIASTSYLFYVCRLQQHKLLCTYSHSSSFCSHFVSLLIRFAHRSLRPSYFLSLITHTHIRPEVLLPSLFFSYRNARAHTEENERDVRRLFFLKSQMFFAVGEPRNICYI